MRQFQIVGFGLGLAAFAVSAFFAGKLMGDTFWKVGMAVMISDIVCILLWPAAKLP